MKTDHNFPLEQLPPRPYPRRCAECDEVAVQPRTIAYDAAVKHDGRLHQFHIADLKIDQCTHCGEQYFNSETDEQISAGLRLHVGLLQPQEIRKQLENLDLTQKDFAEHLRVAQESVSRWITGAAIQSRSLDTLMRLYFQFENVREALSTPGRLTTTTASLPAVTVNVEIVETFWGAATKSCATLSGPLPTWSQGRFSEDIVKRSAAFRLTCTN